METKICNPSGKRSTLTTCAISNWLEVNSLVQKIHSTGAMALPQGVQSIFSPGLNGVSVFFSVCFYFNNGTSWSCKRIGFSPTLNINRVPESRVKNATQDEGDFSQVPRPDLRRTSTLEKGIFTSNLSVRWGTATGKFNPKARLLE